MARSRRMFANDIVTSDGFLDMGQGAQNLYFHLGMQADDDGFVSPNRVMRMVGASVDDLKILEIKQFIISFPSGVRVIRHWREHNTVRQDRYNATTYRLEKSKLVLNGSTYNLDTDGIQSGNQLATNGGISKEVSNKESNENSYFNPENQETMKKTREALIKSKTLKA